MAPQLFTIGHSTHPLDDFLALLARHGVKRVADVRRFPGSRKFPQYYRDDLAASLPQAGIGYEWIEDLGGRRHKGAGDSTENLGLRNQSFRNYADYMRTEPFRNGIDRLLKDARRPTAFMCSEGLFWRCHRRLVSDYLLAQGILVQHIMPSGELRTHTLTEGGRVENGRVTYPAAGGL